MMGFPFHSLVFCSSRQESGGKKKPQTPTKPDQLFGFLQAALRLGRSGHGKCSLLPLSWKPPGFHLGNSSPSSPRWAGGAGHGDAPKVLHVGDPGSALAHRVSRHEWVVLGCPPQLRGPWLRAGGGTYWVTAPLSAAPGSLRRSRSQRRAGPGLLGLGDLRRSQLGPGVIWPQAIILHKAL